MPAPSSAPEFRDANIPSLSWLSHPETGFPVSSVGSPLTAEAFRDIVLQERSLNNTKIVENIRRKSLCCLCFDSGIQYGDSSVCCLLYREPALGYLGFNSEKGVL